MKNKFKFILLLAFLSFNLNAQQNTENMDNNLALATFGNGCFWCTEAIFQRLNGVENVVPGYAGGTSENPTYYEVITGFTGHAEVIQISYNPEVISYRELLDVFFSTNEQTTLKPQANDIGPQ